MFSPVPTWTNGLQQDVETEQVYEPFRRLLAEYLPMELQELAEEVDRDRTTVSKWKSGDRIPSLDDQEKTVEAVQKRLELIAEQVSHVEEMMAALEEVEAAYEEHAGRLDSGSLAELEEANDRVRELLGSKPRD